MSPQIEHRLLEILADPQMKSSKLPPNCLLKSGKHKKPGKNFENVNFEGSQGYAHEQHGLKWYVSKWRVGSQKRDSDFILVSLEPIPQTGYQIKKGLIRRLVSVWFF